MRGVGEPLGLTPVLPGRGSLTQTEWKDPHHGSWALCLFRARLSAGWGRGQARWGREGLPTGNTRLASGTWEP